MNVEKNILIGNINDNRKDENKFNAVTKITGVDDFVDAMPERYNQQLGSWFKDGRQLSGGQWQKIAMARCIYRPASLYLFDEATSALDLMSEKKFYDMLKSRKKNHINICVTHRIKNIQNIDKVFLIDNGEIVKEGGYIDVINNISPETKK